MALNKEKIELEAKQLLDKFASALAKVEKQAKGIDIGVDREEFERIEEESKKFLDENFKKNFLKNAPEHDDDHIIVERGSWK